MRVVLLIATGWSAVVLLFATCVSAVEPWEVNQPICTVRKELYQPNPRPDTILWCWAYYVGPKLQRVEHYIEESAETGDDVHMNPRQRFSNDNGRTWTPFAKRPPITRIIDGTSIQTGRLERPFYDPAASVVIRFHDQAVISADRRKVFHHVFYDLSHDFGRTYGPPSLVRYEKGPTYDPDDILNPDYLSHNYAYPGNNTVRLSNGTLLSVLTETMVPHEEPDGTTKRRPLGSRCLIGTWMSDKKDYQWKLGKPAWIPLSVSPRALQEAQVAELRDGRVMITWRTDAKRRFFGLSSDGGMTISQPAELKYNDGTRFYSPSSISYMLRHSQTGKLYFLGNVSPVPPEGNMPRYPLVIAEIDESIPAVRKNTVTLIDTRQKDESARIQLSNFSLLENRETHEVEIYLSPLSYRYNPSHPASLYEAPIRRYILRLMQ